MCQLQSSTSQIKSLLLINEIIEQGKAHQAFNGVFEPAQSNQKSLANKISLMWPSKPLISTHFAGSEFVANPLMATLHKHSDMFWSILNALTWLTNRAFCLPHVPWKWKPSRILIAKHRLFVDYATDFREERVLNESARLHGICVEEEISFKFYRIRKRWQNPRSFEFQIWFFLFLLLRVYLSPVWGYFKINV